MIRTKKELKSYIKADSANYKFVSLSLWGRIKAQLQCNPISDQKYIWRYIKTMRWAEYYCSLYEKCKITAPLYVVSLLFLKHYSYKTGFQIPPNTCGKGLTIWHWGPIIINPKASIGEYCTLYPGVLIGHKNNSERAARIGNNVFIGAGTKVIGDICIGDNVTIGQNCVITKNVPDNSTIVSSSPRYI